jgi:hypothetical protein
MNGLRRVILPLCALTICACGDMAPRSFDGTWKTIPDKTKFSSEPITISLSNGIYDCNSCIPKIHVRADGSDQLLRAQTNDTITVREIDSRTVKITMKREGKITSELLATAGPDGQTLEATTTTYPVQGTVPYIAESVSERIGLPTPNANAITGSWRIQKAGSSETELLTTFKSNGRELSASWSLGPSWTAKFDGKDYPVKGGFRSDSVSLKRQNGQTIEATYKFHGYIIRVDKLTVSDDGKTLTNVSEDKLTGRINIETATRQ